MTTFHIIIFSILSICSVIGFLGVGFCREENQKEENKKMVFLIILLTTTALFGLIAFTMTEERQQLLKKINNKCPQYEKVENVYKLKE